MSELWDDSVLITAFNSAMTKYKDMHGLPGKNKRPSKEFPDGETDVVRFPAVHPEDRGELENHLLQEAEPSGVQSLEASQGKQEVPLFKSTVDITCTDDGNRSLPDPASLGYPAEWKEQEHYRILSQLQQLAEQQQKLSQELTCLGYTNVGEATTNAECNSFPSSGVVNQTYPAVSDYCYNCHPYCWDAYYKTSWENGPQCQHCTSSCEPCSTSCQETSGKPSGTSVDISTLPEMVRDAIAEALKAAGSEAHTENSNPNRDTGLSDVAVAWFLAGFHTSRYLLRAGEPR